MDILKGSGEMKLIVIADLLGNLSYQQSGFLHKLGGSNGTYEHQPAQGIRAGEKAMQE